MSVSSQEHTPHEKSVKVDRRKRVSKRLPWDRPNNMMLLSDVVWGLISLPLALFHMAVPLEAALTALSLIAMIVSVWSTFQVTHNNITAYRRSNLAVTVANGLCGVALTSALMLNFGDNFAALMALFHGTHLTSFIMPSAWPDALAINGALVLASFLLDLSWNHVQQKVIAQLSQDEKTRDLTSPLTAAEIAQSYATGKPLCYMVCAGTAHPTTGKSETQQPKTA